MKFLAMLKDSLRETLDVKLFHVLAVLSTLIVLFVFSITYKPLPMEPEVKTVVEPRFNPEAWMFKIINHLARDKESANVAAATDITNFQRTDNGDPEKPWLGDYQFNINLKLVVIKNSGPFGQRPKPGEVADPEDVAKDVLKIEAAKKQLSVDFMQNLSRQSFDFLEEVKVEAGPPAEQPNEINYTVTTHGCKIKSAKGWFYQPYLFFGLVKVPRTVVVLLAVFFNGFDPDSLKTLGDMVVFFGDRVVGSIGALFTMFLSIIMTASFLPNMLAKGSVDLLLVKPIHRTTLFLYKFAGGLLFMFLNTSIIMVGIWLAMGVQTGLWAHSLLLCIPVFTFQFAIFYSVAALIAVLTRSTVLSILVAFMWWGLLFVLGWTHFAFIDLPRSDTSPGMAEYRNHWLYHGFDGVKAAMPRYKDLDWLTTRSIRTELNDSMYPEGPVREKNVKVLEEKYGVYDWGTSLLVTSVWIAFFLALACLRFALKDY